MGLLVCMLQTAYAGVPTAGDQHTLLPAPIAPAAQGHDPNHSDKLQVQNYTVEAGKTITIPTYGLDRSLAMNPQPIFIREEKAGEILIEGKQQGATLILLWESAGVRSIRITVTAPKAEIETRAKMARELSPLYRSQKKRAFRFFYDTRYSFQNDGSQLRKVSEVRRVGDHKMAVKGATPYGELNANLMMEYRKDVNTGGGVTMPADAKMGLYDTKIPYMEKMDAVAGTQFVHTDQYGFPGARILGFFLAPSVMRLEKGAARSVHPFFFMGRERDGSTFDSPAGIRNRELKNQYAGAGAQYFIWDRNKISAAGYRRRFGPAVGKSNGNADVGLDLNRGPVRFKAELGADDRNQAAFNGVLFLGTENFSIENSWVNVEKDYRTVTGSTSGSGQLGYTLYAGWYPPEGNLRAYLDSSILRSRTSLSNDPRFRNDYAKTISPRLEWSAPDGSTLQFGAGYEDQRAFSSPLIRKRLDGRYAKDFYLGRRFLENVGLFTTASLESFRKAVDSAGFNANRGGLGMGMSLNLLSGLTLLSQYTIYKISEREPTPPGNPTYPGQFVFQVDYGRQLTPLPGTMRVGVRYTNEQDTFNKTQQPFSQQDRIEGSAGINFRMSPETSIYLDARAVSLKSIVGEAPQAEFSLVTGLRTSALSPIRIAQKGKVEGYVFKDFNANGVRDADEPGLAGFEISIAGGPGKKTDASGFYRLRVKEGQWVVKAAGQVPEGWFFSTVSQQAIELLPGEVRTIQFGVSAQIQVRGRSYLDVNRNSFFDAGDVPMAGIEVQMKSGQRGQTSGEGQYSIFRVLPGANRVSLDLDSLPPGYRTLSPIEKSFDADAGDSITYDVVLGAEHLLSGVVFKDINHDGSKGGDDLGLAGIAVSAGGYKSVTNREGRFFIRDLPVGKWSVSVEKETLPPGYKLASKPYNIEVPTGPLIRQDLYFAIDGPSEKQSA